MKPKAILSFLWSSQFDAMRQFLLMHEPLVVIATAGGLTPGMQATVRDAGCTIEWLNNAAIPADRDTDEATVLEFQFRDYLRSQPRIPGSEDTDGGELLSSVIEERIKVDVPPALRLLNGLTTASNKFDIALLATSEDMTPQGKVATAWAKAQGIPSLHLAHAISLIDPYTVHDQLVADKLAVFGRRAAEGYLDLGIPEDRIIVTGNPAWDGYPDMRSGKAACRQQLDKKYGLDPSLPLVVFGTTWAANLSAFGNERIYAESIAAVFRARESLAQCGLLFNTVIKDRMANKAFGEKACTEIGGRFGASGLGHCYAVEDTQLFAAGADLLIAVDSNFLVEGMLAGTPIINLMNAAGEVMGPCFEAETGVLEVEFDDLADAIHLMLTNAAARTEHLARARARAPHYNCGDGDGRSALRVAQAMAGMAKPLPRRVHRFIWEKYLDVAAADVAETYHTAGRADLAAMYTNSPALLLDVGCAAGATAALIKQRFPGCRAWGIELNRAAAGVAQRKLDRVLIGKFEDFDLEREGIEKGTLDAVLLADVLEHMYNPWDVMVKLRPYMSPTGQLLLSIPNVRNLLLMDDLTKGNWTYSGAGLLDITHIRFFTFKEILRFCRETGYRVISTRNAIDLRLEPFFKQHQSLPLTDINTERLTLKGVTPEELIELCTIQFYFLVERDSTESHQP